MPKIAKELTALQVKRLTHDGTKGLKSFVVGGVPGLMLQITPTGARSWILRNLVAGRRRHIGLGPYPEVSLSQAREDARDVRRQIRSGCDPVEERRNRRTASLARERKALSFASATERFLETKNAEFNNEKHRKQWQSTLHTYALPELGEMPVSEISVADVRRVLDPIWETKTETASRLRGRIEAVLAWATVFEHRTGDNPARWKGNLDAVMPKPSRIARVVHHPALPLNEVGDWYLEVLRRDGFATRALEFLALTAARSGEIRGAQWQEIDFEKSVWTIPADRMKARKEHRVPLGSRAVRLLKDMPRLSDEAYVFTSSRGGMLSDAGLSACMKRIHASNSQRFVDQRSHRPAVPHGIRSTFRDWAAECTEYPREIVEIALAHTVGSDVERAYRRTDLLERRRSLMQDWESFLSAKLEDYGAILEAGRA